MLTLEQRAQLVIRASLRELDAKWRKGTANADFKDPETMKLLRGDMSVHESDVRYFLDLLESGKMRLQIGA